MNYGPSGRCMHPCACTGFCPGSKLETAEQLLAEAQARIGELRQEPERLLLLIQRTAATLETVGAVGHADWLRQAAGVSKPAQAISPVSDVESELCLPPGTIAVELGERTAVGDGTGSCLQGNATRNDIWLGDTPTDQIKEGKRYAATLLLKPGGGA